MEGRRAVRERDDVLGAKDAGKCLLELCDRRSLGDERAAEGGGDGVDVLFRDRLAAVRQEAARHRTVSTSNATSLISSTLSQRSFRSLE